jgi:hypothetical protein
MTSTEKQRPGDSVCHIDANWNLVVFDEEVVSYDDKNNSSAILFVPLANTTVTIRTKTYAIIITKVLMVINIEVTALQTGNCMYTTKRLQSILDGHDGKPNIVVASVNVENWRAMTVSGTDVWIQAENARVLLYCQDDTWRARFLRPLS